MAKATPASIRAQSDKLHRRWLREYAGKPRHTRALAELERMVDKTAALLKKAKGIRGDKGRELAEVVAERLKLYRDERDAIADAQFERPEVAEIHTLGQRVDHVVALWRRRYAGRDRRTRDLSRLEAIIATLETALPRLEELSEHPEVKKDALAGLWTQLELLKDERSEIVKLRKNADDETRRTALLAEAQSALDQYRVHFAGQPRVTGSPRRLRRMIASLEGITRALAEDEQAGEQRAQLEPQLDGWRAELPQIEQAHGEADPRQRTSQLGGMANQLFQIYQREFAGQARATRDLERLSDVCDRLGELSELMIEHDQATSEPINRKNMPLVEERLRHYEQEWNEIAKAIKSAGSQPGGAEITISDE